MYKKICCLNINRILPPFEDGGSISTFELLSFFNKKGHIVEIVTFYTESKSVQVSLKELFRTEKRISNVHFGMYKKIKCLYKKLPIAKECLYKNFQDVLKHILPIIKEKKFDYVITLDDDFLSLLAVTLLQIPGAHFYHSYSNIISCKKYPVFTKLLKARKVFTVSSFLGKKLYETLNIDSIVWHPFFPSDKLYQIKEKNCKKCIGYYSAGRDKGDDIVNAIIKKKGNWKFIVIGTDYSYTSFDKNQNVSIWGFIETIDTFLNEIDVLLVPSIMNEGFSRIIVEACSYGIPVIANNVGGISESMGFSGVLIDYTVNSNESVETVSNKYIIEIEKLYNNIDYYESLKNKALFRSKEYKKQMAAMSEKNYKIFLNS